MISNAAIVSITSPRVSDGSGGYAAGTTVAVANGRCMIDVPSKEQRSELVGELSSVTAMIFGQLAATVDGLAIVGATLACRTDGAAADVTHRIRKRVDRVKRGGMTHVELWVDKA